MKFIDILLVLIMVIPTVYVMYVFVANDLAYEKISRKEEAITKFLGEFGYVLHGYGWKGELTFSVISDDDTTIPCRIFYSMIKKAYYSENKPYSLWLLYRKCTERGSRVKRKKILSKNI